MIRGLYSVRDELIGYGNPVSFPSDSVAIREFKILASESKSPQDLVLFKVGSFDDQSGEIVEKVHVQLVRATEVIE